MVWVEEVWKMSKNAFWHTNRSVNSMHNSDMRLKCFKVNTNKKLFPYSPNTAVSAVTSQTAIADKITKTSTVAEKPHKAPYYLEMLLCSKIQKLLNSYVINAYSIPSWKTSNNPAQTFKATKTTWIFIYWSAETMFLSCRFSVIQPIILSMLSECLWTL